MAEDPGATRQEIVGGTVDTTARFPAIFVLKIQRTGGQVNGCTGTLITPRTLLTAGSFNTLPLEIYGMTTNVTTPVLYALGTVTTVFSFLIIGATIGLIALINRKRLRA